MLCIVTNILEKPGLLRHSFKIYLKSIKDDYDY